MQFLAGTVNTSRMACCSGQQVGRAWHARRVGGGPTHGQVLHARCRASFSSKCKSRISQMSQVTRLDSSNGSWWREQRSLTTSRNWFSVGLQDLSWSGSRERSACWPGKACKHRCATGYTGTRNRGQELKSRSILAFSWRLRSEGSSWSWKV